MVGINIQQQKVTKLKQVLEAMQNTDADFANAALIALKLCVKYFKEQQKAFNMPFVPWREWMALHAKVKELNPKFASTYGLNCCKQLFETLQDENILFRKPGERMAGMQFDLDK